MSKCALVQPREGLSTSVKDVLTFDDQHTVYQHSSATNSHPLPMPDVSDNTLAAALLMRFNRGIDSTVGEYSLFALWCAIDDELTRRKSPELL